MECSSGKECFTKGLAKQVMRDMNSNRRKRNRRSTGHAPARVYECDLCGKYHITGSKEMKIKVKKIDSEYRIKTNIK